MRLRLGNIRCALVVAPHPDDEIIGAAGLIRSLKALGAKVVVAIVSDGGASHPGSRRWPRTRLVAARRRESLRALRRLGVPAGDVRLLGLPDGRLHEHEWQGRRWLRRIVADTGADLIVGPAEGDAHRDHQIVAQVMKRLPKTALSLTYQVWPTFHRAGGKTMRHVAAGGAASKRSLIRLHRTQMGAIRDDPAGFAIARHELAVFCHPIEVFVEVVR